jgi:putative MFS transporter
MNERQIDRILDRIGPSRVFRLLLLTACLGYLLDAFDNSLMGYAVPALAKDFELTDVTKGYILSAGLWGGVIGQFAWGRLAEMRGRLYAFRGTVLMFAGFTGLTALAWSPLTLFSTRFLTGAGLAGFTPIDTAMVSELSATNRRGRYTGLIAVLWPVGAMLGLAVSLLILPRASWRWLFVVGALPAIVLWNMRRKIPESPRWLLTQNRSMEAVQSLRQLGATELILEEELDASPENPIASNRPRSITDVLPRHLMMHVFIAWCMWFANLYASMSLIVWLPSIVNQVYHYSLINSLQYTLVITAFGFLGRLLGVYLLDKTGRKFSLGYALFLAGVCMFALGYTANIHVAMILAMSFYFFNEQAGISQMAYIPELFPTQIRVKGTAWCSASARIVAATSPILVGYLLSAGHYRSIAMSLSMTLLVPWIIFVIWAPEMRGKGLAEEIA